MGVDSCECLQTLEDPSPSLRRWEEGMCPSGDFVSEWFGSHTFHDSSFLTNRITIRLFKLLTYKVITRFF